VSRVARGGLDVALRPGPRADRSRCAEHRVAVGRSRRTWLGWFCGFANGGGGTDPCRIVGRICRPRRWKRSARTLVVARPEWQDTGSRSRPHWLNGSRTRRSNSRCDQPKRLRCKKCDGARPCRMGCRLRRRHRGARDTGHQPCLVRASPTPHLSCSRSLLLVLESGSWLLTSRASPGRADQSPSSECRSEVLPTEGPAAFARLAVGSSWSQTSPSGSVRRFPGTTDIQYLGGVSWDTPATTFGAIRRAASVTRFFRAT
jgi:hypothetical protein